jgi:hypothetical protein
MESVEWKGIFSIWEYSNQLRSVVYKLAYLRVDGCYKDANKQIFEKISEVSTELSTSVRDLTGKPFPIPRNIFQDPSFDKSSLKLPSLKVFERLDSFEFLKTFSPSLIMGAISYIGLKTLGLAYFKSAPTLKLGRVFFTGLGIACTGLAMLKIADTQKEVQSRVTLALKEYFEESDFVGSHSRLIVSMVRDNLYYSMKEIQNSLNSQIDKNNQDLKNISAQHEKVETISSSLSSLLTRAQALESQLKEINVRNA